MQIYTFYVLTALVMSSVFWGIMPCSPLKVTLFHAGSLLCIFFDPEDGVMFLRKVHWPSTDCTALYPRIQNCVWVLYLSSFFLIGDLSESAERNCEIDSALSTYRSQGCKCDLQVLQ
jgi:hypothetical protein